LNYIPDTSNNYINTPIITFRVNIHLFCKSDGSGVYPLSDTTIFQQQVAWVNQMYTYISQPTLPMTPPAEYINDTRIRFELVKIYFHNNDTFYSSSELCGNTYEARWGINKANDINVFYFQNPSYPQGSGCGIHPTSSEGGYADLVCITSPNWASAQLLAHELGHVLGLYHTGDCSGSTCVNSGGFSDTYQPDCNKGWLNCGATNIPNPVCPSGAVGISNNIMGYNICRSYMSPQQMGSMLDSAKSDYAYTQYLDCTYNSANSVTVSSNTTWNIGHIITGNLTVTNNSTLTVECSLIMGNNSTITVTNGSSLILASGAIITGGDVNFWNGTLLVKGGAQLTMNSTSQIRMNSTGEILIDNDANGNGNLTFNQNSLIYLNDATTSLVIKGNLTLPNPAVFTFTGNGKFFFNPAVNPSNIVQ
jgi:hypothetical protein